MNSNQLTKLQLEFYDFIVDHLKRERLWPTYEVIKKEFGWTSSNNVRRMLKALVKKGYLEQDGGWGSYKLTGKRPGLPAEVRPGPPLKRSEYLSDRFSKNGEDSKLENSNTGEQ